MKDLEKKPLSVSFEQLAENILAVDHSLHGFTVKAINQAVTIRNWIIGGYIIEYEQHGEDRAQYGEQLLKSLETRIDQKGLNVTLFQVSRLFYRYYPQLTTLVLRKYATLSNNSAIPALPIYATVSHISVTSSLSNETDSNPSRFSTAADVIISSLSFSHIKELLTIDDPLVRFFYETECIRGTWSVRELRRQIATNLHIRVGLSEDKMAAMAHTHQQAETQTSLLSIKDPYTFEFLGLKPKDVVSEDNLEDALIEHLQEFLIELGKGFCFEARQKRIIIDGEYYFADLVFYNRFLHCNVIVEIKNDVFRHEHIGQLNAYVSHYAENEMQPGDNPPIGILLCTQKGKKMVEYALGGMDSQLFVSTYQLQLPNKQQLERFILEKRG